MVSFNVSSDKGLAELNSYLSERSYVVGYQPSQADVTVFDALGKAPDASKFAYVSRWFSHLQAFTVADRSGFPGSSSAVTIGEAKAEAKESFDLFADDEEEDEAYEKELEERRKAAVAAKGGKQKKDVIAKSMVIMDVKPWDDETPMDKLEECVRSIVMDGLVWGTSKLVPVGYGIKKLQIGSVIEDDKVSVDDLEEKIVAFEQYVQSMDIAAFNKL